MTETKTETKQNLIDIDIETEKLNKKRLYNKERYHKLKNNTNNLIYHEKVNNYRSCLIGNIRCSISCKQCLLKRLSNLPSGNLLSNGRLLSCRRLLH